jgi:hypothetical protein
MTRMDQGGPAFQDFQEYTLLAKALYLRSVALLVDLIDRIP